MKLHRLVIIFFIAITFGANAQILDYNDPIVEHDPDNPVTKPANGILVDWVRTKQQSWNTDKWKAYYMSGLAFRLRFPNNYDPNRAEEYPVIVIIHGLGYSNKPPEAIYENEKHLSNSGAKAYEDAINQNKFDGFVLSPSSLTGWFNGAPQYIIDQILGHMDNDLNVDLNRVSLVGRSGGAWSCWWFLAENPKTYAAVLPLAGINDDMAQFVDNYKHISTWVHQGENDDHPYPHQTEALLENITGSGANVRYTKYWGAGHGIFNQAYAEPDYFPFLTRVHKANPAVLDGVYTSTFENNKKIFYEWVPDTQPCPGDPINVTMGLTPGFNAYEWRKDGVIIPGETGHEITVTELGTYDARFSRGGTWSEWSPIPVEIQLKDPTLTPDIAIEGVASAVIPTLDNETSVRLELPQGYAEYEWRDANTNQVVGTERVFEALQPGDYLATVTENFGCSSSPSPIFTVIDANGVNSPEDLLDLDGAAISKTEIKLVWSSNPNDFNPATGFEIYRSDFDATNFEYLGTVDGGDVEYIDTDLLPDTEYFYKLRGVNANGASGEITTSAIKTQVDQNAPTPPTNLSLVSATSYSATLTWDESIDDVEVYRYDIYRDGIKVSSTPNTTAEVFNLVANRIYTFMVKARDLTGNESPFSNRLVVTTAYSAGALANLKFNGDLSDDSPSGTVSNGTATIETVDVIEGSGSFAFDGNTVIDFADNKSFVHDAFTERSIAFWFKSTETGGTQDMFDEGGATNGIGIRLIDETIQFTVQDNHDIFSLEAPCTRNEWHHVVGTFKDGVLKLYLDGALVVQRSDIDYPGLEVSTHTDESGIGGTNGSNAFDVVSDRFEGFMDDFYLFSYALGLNDVENLYDIENIASIPEETIHAPEDITATATSYDEIQVTWTDASDNEESFQIYRSEAGGASLPVAFVGANETSYTDTGLKPATKYSYSVIALTQYNESGASVAASIPSIGHYTFEGNYVDQSSNNISTGRNGTESYSNDSQQGNSSFQFDGNTYLDPDTGNKFIHSAFTQRSFAFWFKSEDEATANQDILDEGGSTNGIGIRLLGHDIQLTSQNGHQIFSAQAPVTRNEWHHVVGIFDTGSLRLYLDGVLVAENNGVSYTTVNSHGNGGGLGGTNSSNAFDQVSSRFTGLIDDFYFFDTAVDDIVSQIISSANPTNIATTFDLPPAPAAPVGVVLNDVGYDFVDFSFEDVSNNEDYFEILRAINTPTSFQPLDTVETAANGVVNYVDQSLQSNITYFYKVAAVNAGGAVDSPELEARTLNYVPELTGLPDDITMQFGTTFDINILATDIEGDALTITGNNLPSFATLTDYTDGSGLLRLEPTETDGGTYPEVEVVVTDAFGGAVSHSFDLEVNGNNLPTLSSVATIMLDEGTSTSATITATDEEGVENLTWTFDVPSFVVPTINPDGTTDFAIDPGFADAGAYAATVTVEDLDGATATSGFDIFVADINPNRLVKINFTFGAFLGDAGWNNTDGHPQQGDTYANLLDDQGVGTGFDLSVVTNWTSSGSNTSGASTGNNSGVLPDNVMRSAYWTYTKAEQIRLTGLDDSKSYKLGFFGSRNATDNRTSLYTVAGQSTTLDAAGNTTDIVELIVQSTGGELLIQIERTNGSTFGYLNALLVEELFDTGEAPDAPNNLVGNFNPGENQINLTWNERAFNETGYKLYKSVQPGGTLTELVDLPAGSSSYSDAAVAANSDYSYQVSAYNDNGESFSDEIFVSVPNIAPALASIEDVAVSITQDANIAITATDDPGDVISLSVTGLPSFGTFTDNGDGTGSIVLDPAAEDLGSYAMTVEAADDKGGVSQESFNVEVTPEGLHTYYINIAATNTFLADAPWNNYVGNGTGGLNNISAEQSGFNSIDMTLLDSWEGYNTSGMTGSTVYPDDVTRASIWMSTTAERRISLTGLNPNYAYDLTFFASRNGGGNRTTDYTIDGATVSLNASYNVNNTVTLEGILPDGSGEIIVRVKKGAGASYGYINSMVVTGYQAEALPAEPTDLVASPIDGSSISLGWKDNSNSEISYEVWRSTSSNGTYNLIETLGANVTSYVNAGVGSGITYYYKVRAMLPGDVPTGYSNVAGTSTINSVISINFNVSDPEVVEPWNNTNSFPDPGLIFSNLTDANGNNTGVAFEIVAENPELPIDPSLYGFSGDNPFGENTGNNSGVVPDNVMRSTYWMDAGRVAELKFFNLDLSQNYNFKFFASRDGGGDRTSVYSINGESVSLNASNNISNIVEITNIEPDDNGEIWVSVTSSPTASYSYLGAIIMSSSNRVTANARVATNNPETAEELLAEELNNLDIKVYPNPHREGVLRITAGNDETLSVQIIDLQGKVVYADLLESQGGLVEVKGVDQLATGSYLIDVRGAQIGQRTLRLIKR